MKTAFAGLFLWEVSIAYSTPGIGPRLRTKLLIVTRRDDLGHALAKAARFLKKNTEVYPYATVNGCQKSGTIDA